MGEENKPNIFNGKQELFFAEIGDKVFKKLPIVEGSVKHTGYYDAPELRKSMDSISFSVKVDNPAELLLLQHPDVQRCLDYARSMLNEIQSEVKRFYRTDPPRNRKERRARAKALEMKIKRFNAYCRAKGIEISSK